MVLDPLEPQLPTPEDNCPAIQKLIPEEGYLDMPMLEEGYPEWYPDSPCSHWMYDL
jgi:hypothetical protein